MMALGPNLIDLVWYTTLDSATDTTVGKSKEFSINLKKRVIDLNTSGKSLGDISKQLQVQRTNVQTTVSIKCMTQSGIKLSPAAERKMVKSQPITTKKGSHTVWSNIKPVRWVPSPAHSDKTGLLIMVLLCLTDQPTRRTWTPSWIYGIVKMKMRDSNTTTQMSWWLLSKLSKRFFKLKLRIKKLAFPWYSTFFRRPWLHEWLFCSIRFYNPSQKDASCRNHWNWKLPRCLHCSLLQVYVNILNFSFHIPICTRTKHETVDLFPTWIFIFCSF